MPTAALCTAGPPIVSTASGPSTTHKGCLPPLHNAYSQPPHSATGAAGSDETWSAEREVAHRHRPVGLAGSQELRRPRIRRVTGSLLMSRISIRGERFNIHWRVIQRQPGRLCDCLPDHDEASFGNQARASPFGWASPPPSHLASRTPQLSEMSMSSTPHAPPEVGRGGLTARAACTPFGWV